MTSNDPSPYRRLALAGDLKSEALPRAVAPVWGAFLCEGLMTSKRDPYQSERLLNFWSSGRMKLMIESCRYLDRIWAYSRRHWGHLSPKYGTFEYEVISAFGDLLGVHLILNHGELPSDEEADLIIRDLVDAFFTREDAP